MALLLYLTIFSMVQGLFTLQGNHNRVAPQSNFRLKNSARLHKETYSQSRKYSPFMMQLYQTLTMGNGTSPSSLEGSVLQDSDTILSLSAKRCKEMGSHRALYFDMSSFSNINDVPLAELRINFLPSENYQNVTLEIYHYKEGHHQILLGSFSTHSANTLESAWRVFNLTKMLNSYLNLQRSTIPQGFQEVQDTPHRSYGRNCRDIPTDRVTLVVFTKDNPASKINGYPNLIQTVESSKHVTMPSLSNGNGIKKRRSLRDVPNSLVMNALTPRAIETGRPLCQRVDMHVDFEKYGWNDIIIYPKKFNAYRCAGSCPIPLNEMFKPTNHAYIRSLLNFFNAERVECPLCAPVKMRPMSMLMYEEGKVVFKNHEDMIIEECGCQ
ncbi:nodal homolog 2-A-like [Hyperolius riggenbachi]|uniref:nodal homolog 2-A-like n=1 Tax=Hyperolius riggenbachi TaxID=752182 RepID=UPI0035A35BB3